MSKHFVRILSKIDCEWECLPPNYRLYVNDELFVERTWAWDNELIEENLQIEAEPGDYKLSYELVTPHLAKMKILDLRVDTGPAEIVNNTHFRILNETV
jgi:hypothetical protein